MLPDRATRVAGERLEDVSVAELRDGDLVLVRAGARFPADGIARDGASSIDEPMLTGESRPVNQNRVTT